MFQHLFNVEVIYMIEDMVWEPAEVLTMADYLQVVHELDYEVHHSDAWVKVVRFIYAPK